MIRARVVAVALTVWLARGAARGAELRHELAFSAGGELTFTPGLGGHGYGLLRYDLRWAKNSGHLALELNTDTLRLSYDRRVGRVELGVVAAGEAIFAGVLGDYYRQGARDAARGFYASYASLQAYAKVLRAPHYLELALGGRRWFFAGNGDTSAALVLPPEAWVGELRLRYTLWRLRGDPWSAQTPYPRVVGFAFGVELGLDERSEARPWGARDAASFAPVDPRNDPSRTSFMARQWLRAGVTLQRRVRLQLAEVASWMWGADDLVRLRVGGMNPYVVPLAGAPWAAFVAGNLAAVEASLHVRVAGRHELGVLVDGVALADAERLGPGGRPALEAGLGAFADLRFGLWQLDLRAGWSPTVQPGALGSFGVFVALGRQLLRRTTW